MNLNIINKLVVLQYILQVLCFQLLRVSTL